MNGDYKATKGEYRETVEQIRTITEVRAPTIAGQENYAATHLFEFEFGTKDKVLVKGQNGSLSIGVKRGKPGILNRIAQAYNLLLNRGANVYGAAPAVEYLSENPVIQQYLVDSAAFKDIMTQKKVAVTVISDKRVQIDAAGAKEISLEERL